MKFLTWLWNRGKPSFVQETSDREIVDVSRSLTPQKVDAIMRAANGGDTRDQCRLSAELLEHNIEIAQAVSTRINAVLGLHWSFEPGDGTPEAKQAAEQLTREIKAIGSGDNFDELLEDMMGAILPGFSVSEILWTDGGHIAGFNSIEQRNFTLTDGYVPKLITSLHPQGLTLPPESVIYHRFRFHGKDPARGGLIRPLAWFHCFNNGTEKNLLAFMERYGMPFLVVRVDETTWQKERHNIKDLIRNFGSSGGGLFSKGTEQELLQAANSDGNIYFRMKEYLAGAVNQLILGQTASSGDSSGLSKGDAQSKVRQDIIESDCRRIQRTINSQLCGPWTRFNFGSGVAAPRFVIDCAAPEDKLATAQMIQALSGAGLEADPEEMSERFSMKLTRREAAVPAFSLTGPTGPTSPTEDPDAAHNLNLKQKYDAMGVAIRAGLLTATPEIEEQTRTELGLPAMSPEVKKAWDATGGIRQPITLKTAEAEAVNDALDVKEGNKALSDRSDKSDKSDKALSDALEEWLGPIADQIAATSELSDEDLDKILRKGLPVKHGDSAKIEAVMTADMRREYGNQNPGR